MRVVLATSNQGKLKEFQEALLPLGWELLPMPVGLTMPIEDGSSYEENALIKGRSLKWRSGCLQRSFWWIGQRYR
jgi:XTP/dITP diphosphohydrolase